MTRPIILTLTDHYLPGFKVGGPLRSIVNLVGSLGGEFDFRILCADRDLGDRFPYPGVELNRWISTESTLVHYTSPDLQTLASFARIIRQTPHDILYLNSFFSPRFAILPLCARRLGLIPRRPLVIAPRGEFSPGALELKRAKKNMYITFGKITGLFTGLNWQASSLGEEADIGAALRKHARDTHIAMDLSNPLPSSPPLHEPRILGEPFRVAFLSRISPKKNLDYALRVLALVKAPVAFSIYGPAEDTAYFNYCKKLVRQLPSNVSVKWKGPLDPLDVSGSLAMHDLFFLPTRGENYGHVIAEALGAGTPVLISDTTPWRGLTRLGIGYDLPLADPTAFAAAIERAAASSHQEIGAQRASVFSYARQRQLDSATVEANRRLFAAALKSSLP